MMMWIEKKVRGSWVKIIFSFLLEKVHQSFCDQPNFNLIQKLNYSGMVAFPSVEVPFFWPSSLWGLLCFTRDSFAYIAFNVA